MLEETGEDFVRAQAFDGWQKMVVDRWLHEKAWARATTDEERATLALEFARQQYAAARVAEEASRDVAKPAMWFAVVVSVIAIVFVTATVLFAFGIRPPV